MIYDVTVEVSNRVNSLVARAEHLRFALEGKSPSEGNNKDSTSDASFQEGVLQKQQRTNRNLMDLEEILEDIRILLVGGNIEEHAEESKVPGF